MKKHPLIKYRRQYFRYGQCKAIVGQTANGPKYCGDVAIFKSKTFDTGEDLPLCEDHYYEQEELFSKGSRS